MFKISFNKKLACISINNLANICGYFFNSYMSNQYEICPNNGYNCRHPNCEEIINGIGCCHAWSCPFGWEADEQDCSEFGIEYEEAEFVVTENDEIIKRLIK